MPVSVKMEVLQQDQRQELVLPAAADHRERRWNGNVFWVGVIALFVFSTILIMTAVIPPFSTETLTSDPGKQSNANAAKKGSMFSIEAPTSNASKKSNANAAKKGSMGSMKQKDGSFESFRTEQYWRVDPAVYQDPYIRNFPHSEEIAVKNAKFMAKVLRKHLQFDGFEVKRAGKHVGFMPVMYMGFPKHGTTAAFKLMTKLMPCLIKRDAKEPHFWTRMWQPRCQKVNGVLLQGCNELELVDSFILYLHGADHRNLKHVSNEKQMLAEGRCQPPFWIDGSTPTLWERKLKGSFGEEGNMVREVPFETLVLLQELTPRARFLIVAREWAASLLRSSWWFFKSDAATGWMYKQDLKKHKQELAAAAQQDSVCKALFTRDFSRPRINSWADSCKAAAIRQVFGERSLFVAEVGPFMSCDTDFFRWFATGLARDLGVPARRLPDYGSECDADVLHVGDKLEGGGSFTGNAHDHSHEDEEITPEIEALEQELLHLAAHQLWPLLPSTSHPAESKSKSKSKSESDFDSDSESESESDSDSDSDR